MKKVININFQGRVIPIEEPAYEILKKYIESLRNYFAKEEGREEIINDIENRIAELFGEKLKSAQTAFISEEHVSAIMASMGTPDQFDAVEMESGTASFGAAQNQRSGASYSEPRGSLFRNKGDKMLGGVCSGLGAYLRIDTTIVRVLFAMLTFGAFGTGFVLYVILWAVLPAKYMDDTVVARKLYRDTDQKAVGGVCSGIAKYFNIAVWIPRLIFAVPIILGIFKIPFTLIFFPFVASFSGTMFIIYIILWAVVPKAVTASEKLEMRGEKVDLNTIKNKVQDELKDVKKNFTDNAQQFKQGFTEKAGTFAKEAGETAGRFAEETGPVIKKTSGGLLRFLFGLIKVFFFLFVGLIAVVLTLVVFAFILGGAALMPLKDFLVNSEQMQWYAWGTILLFFAVPIIGLIISLVKRIAGIKNRTHYLTYTFVFLWIMGWVSVMLFVSSIAKEYKRQGSLRTAASIQQPSKGRMKVEFTAAPGKYYPLDLNFGFDKSDRHNESDGLLMSATEDSLLISPIKLKLRKSLDDSFHVTLIKRARGSSVLAAEQFAERIPYQVNQSDSILSLPTSFPITTSDKFRNQQIIVEITVPVGKEIYVSGGPDQVSWIDFNGDAKGITINIDQDDDEPSWRNGVWYIMTENGIEKKFKEPSDDQDELEFRYRDSTINIKIKPEVMVDPEVPVLPEEREHTEISAYSGPRKLFFTAISLLKMSHYIRPNQNP